MNDSSTSDHRQFLQHTLLGTAGVGMAIASTGNISAEPVPEAPPPFLPSPIPPMTP